MTLLIEKIEVVSVSGDVVYTLSSSNGQGTGTLVMSPGPAQNPVVTEAVRKTIADYGDTLRKLSNE